MSSTPDRPTSGLRASFRDVVLIVVGVLIALSLEAMWQYRADRADEDELLAGLLMEFRENVDALDR